ncbi:MAG: PQQ-binding-like beta-propeller repeat protein [Pirellulales bacterium]
MQLRFPLRAALRSLRLWSLLLLFAVSTAAQAQQAYNVVRTGPDPLDWPNWRGPQQNRISMEKDLVDNWKPEGGAGSNLIWKREDLGGRTSPIVMRGKLYTIVRDQPEKPNEGEMVVCVDAATGETIWKHRFNVYLSDVPDTRIGWSAPVGDPETGRIYVQGVCGYFCCLDGETGKVIWDRSLHEEFGLVSTYGGRTNVPIVFEDTVLISAVIVGWGDEPKWGGLARPAHRFLCFDKATGELRWLNGTGISPYDTTYSTPTLMPIAGQQALVFASGDGGVWALQPRTGKSIWNYTLSRAGVNISPIVAPDGRVYVSHAKSNPFGNSQGSVVALDGTKSGKLDGTELWQQIEVNAGDCSPILVDGRLYVIDDSAKMFIYDAATGKQIARQPLGTAMRGTPLYADGKIYLCTNTGQWYILQPTATGVRVVHRLRLPTHPTGGSPSSEGSMAVSHGRIYLPTLFGMYCIGKPDQKPSADPLPVMPREAPLTDTNASLVQVVPYDTLLAPGAQQDYRVRLFNAKGQLLRDVPAAEVRFGVDGIGMISAEGKYTAPTDAGHECALVTCEVGELKGTARVRITPPLPWTFDFNQSDKPPLTWIGGRVRWQVRDQAGEKYLAKLTELPTPKDPHNKLGTRSFIWMGPTDLSNYTVQAEMLWKEDEKRISDAGVINSCYQLTVRGLNKKLRLDSWTTSDYRTHAEADFTPQPDVWYKLKLTVVPEGSRAQVRGKIWRRGDPEPNGWAVEMIDTMPNLHGTPGVFGKTEVAEVYLDNLLVTPN